MIAHTLERTALRWGFAYPTLRGARGIRRLGLQCIPPGQHLLTHTEVVDGPSVSAASAFTQRANGASRNATAGALDNIVILSFTGTPNSTAAVSVGCTARSGSSVNRLRDSSGHGPEIDVSATAAK